MSARAVVVVAEAPGPSLAQRTIIFVVAVGARGGAERAALSQEPHAHATRSVQCEVRAVAASKHSDIVRSEMLNNWKNEKTED